MILLSTCGRGIDIRLKFDPPPMSFLCPCLSGLLIPCRRCDNVSSCVHCRRLVPWVAAVRTRAAMDQALAILTSQAAVLTESMR